MKIIFCGSRVPDRYSLLIQHKEEVKWSSESWAGWQGGASICHPVSSLLVSGLRCPHPALRARRGAGADSEGARGLRCPLRPAVQWR